MKTEAAARPQRPTKKRLTGAERRRRLVRAAIEAFSRHGFDGATTKQISESAGVNEALLFRDFGTKQGLYEAILDLKAEESQTDDSLHELRVLAERKDDRAFVRFLILKILQSYRDDPQYQRLMLYAALEGHELSKLFNETRGIPIFGFLVEYVEQRQKDGVFAAGDPRSIAFALVGLPTYYAIVRRLFDNDFLGLSDDEAVDVFASLVLDGLITQRPKTASRTNPSRSGRKK